MLYFIIAVVIINKYDVLLCYNFITAVVIINKYDILLCCTLL